MKWSFKNNVVTNPKGWARKMVGSAFYYRAWQVITIGFGLMCLDDLSHGGCDPYYGARLLILGWGILLPLGYLRALRQYVVTEGPVDESN